MGIVGVLHASAALRQGETMKTLEGQKNELLLAKKLKSILLFNLVSAGRLKTKK